MYPIQVLVCLALPIKGKKIEASNIMKVQLKCSVMVLLKTVQWTIEGYHLLGNLSLSLSLSLSLFLRNSDCCLTGVQIVCSG